MEQGEKMENKKIDEKFLKKTFPENYKINMIDTLHYKIETPFLDDFKANISLYVDATDLSGKIRISDNKTIFGNLGLLHKKDIERMKNYVKQHFPKNCYFSSDEEELIYEVEIDASDRWFSEKFRFSVHNFISLMSKIFGFVEISNM